MSKKETNAAGHRITNEKPVSLFPLDFKEAIAALLKVKPKPPEKKSTKKRTKKPSG
jgi:hypothetical protein